LFEGFFHEEASAPGHHLAMSLQKCKIVVRPISISI